MSQFLDRIKYGSGKSGSPAVSGTINTYATCTGTATQFSLTTALAASTGDCILIIQSQGTGVGQWEINYVLADAGATLTLAYPLAYSYVTGSQVILMPQYTGGTLSGAVISSDWNGSTNGIIALMCNDELTISGSLTPGNGFRGAQQNTTTDNDGYQGEGTLGAGNTRAITTNGNGGGGGDGGSGLDFSSGGGGGGNGAVGTQGQAGQQHAGGLGGLEVGNAALTNFCFGGGGSSGGMGRNSATYAAAGGNGAGGIFIFAKKLIVTGSFNLNGVAGTNGAGGNGGGGGGAGGSCLIKCQSAILGTNKITASGGAGGVAGGTNNGGAGAAGRIHIDYSDTYSGTTTPTITATQDSTLKSQLWGGMI